VFGRRRVVTASTTSVSGEHEAPRSATRNTDAVAFARRRGWKVSTWLNCGPARTHAICEQHLAQRRRESMLSVMRGQKLGNGKIVHESQVSSRSQARPQLASSVWRLHGHRIGHFHDDTVQIATCEVRREVAIARLQPQQFTARRAHSVSRSTHEVGSDQSTQSDPRGVGFRVDSRRRGRTSDCAPGRSAMNVRMF